MSSEKHDQTAEPEAARPPLHPLPKSNYINSAIYWTVRNYLFLTDVCNFWQVQYRLELVMRKM